MAQDELLGYWVNIGYWGIGSMWVIRSLGYWVILSVLLSFSLIENRQSQIARRPLRFFVSLRMTIKVGWDYLPCLG